MWRHIVKHSIIGPTACVSSLTGIRRVGRGAVEERGRSSQVGHAGVVGVAVHGAGDGGVTGLLWRGARDVTVRRHTTAAAHETCSKQPGSNRKSG